MTLLLFDGIDNATVMPKPFMTYGGNSSGTQAGRDGSTNGAYGIAGSSGSPNVICTLATTPSTAILGVGVKCGSFNGRIRVHNTAGTVQCSVGFNGTTGRYELYTGDKGAVLASSAVGVVYTVNTFVHLQIKATLHNTTGNVVVRLNNVEIINFTGATATASFSVGSFQFPTSAGGGTDRLTIDDLWVCDTVDATSTQGLPNNDFLGDLKVVALVPTSAGDDTNWTPSTGANYTTLDENPPSPTADYVEASAATSGTRDLYNVTDLPAGAATVFGLDSRIYALKTDVGTAITKQVIKENSTISTIGTHYLGTSITPYTSNFITKRPSDNANLTVADVNSLQVGVETG